jgi:hypothetical protein
MITDWNEVGDELENYYGMFYAFWKVGIPELVDDIPTAAVTFDKKGNFVRFIYNEEFWERLSFDERVFITAHEMLHIMLNHGKRCQGLQPEVSNIAADVVVNEMLVRHYGLDRDKITFADNLCWLDTVFPDGSQAYGLNFEQYYNALMADVPESEFFMIDDVTGLPKNTEDFVQDVIDGAGYDAWELAGELNEVSQMDGDSPKSKSWHCKW